MDSQSNFNGGNDTMSKTTMQNTKSHFGGSILPRMCMASSSSTTSTNSQQTDSGISSASSQSSSSQTTLSKYECIQHCSFPNCNDVNKYERIAKIGHGTYGEVFKARQPSTNQFVALKRILGDSGKPGFPITALREIRILKRVKHKNVVDLIEICRSTATASNRYRSHFYLVFEFCEHDLAGLLSNTNVRFNLGEIKSIVKQLLEALYFIHNGRKIMHRDLKPANILLTKNGVLKLADFGLSREFNVPIDCHDDNPRTPPNRIVTLWYRPPELLLGDTNYGPAIDLWGVGCIMAEMWTRMPIMQGRTEQQQILLISHLCGSFTPKVWPGVEKLPFYSKIQLPLNQSRKVKERLRAYVKDTLGLNLIDQLLQLNPRSRFDAEAAINHDFFWTDPMPAEDMSRMFSKYTRSMFELHTRQKPERPKEQLLPNQPAKRARTESGYVDHIY